MEAPSPLPRAGSPSSEVAAPITDFALIESQKENIRPLATGRSAATLGALFDKTTSWETQRAIDEGHEKFKNKIEEAERRDREGEDMVDGVQDVLDPYYRYTLFMVQHYPSAPSEVLPLLESTTRRFVKDARYGQDARYLKLWVMYARLVERREEVWAFLESKDIGTNHASFYEEWATALEGLGRKKKADDIYKLGVARRAAPLERLKSRHQAFLARIMAPPSGEVPDDEPVRAPARSALGGGGVAPSQQSISGMAATTPAQTRVSKGHNGSKMAVFSDPDAKADAGEGDRASEWADFGTRDGRRKENVVEATPWKGETLPQSASKRVAPRTPKMEVFRDTGDDNAVRTSEEALGGLRKQPQSDAEVIRANPLRLFDTNGLSTDIPSLPAPPSARKAKPASSSFKRKANPTASGSGAGFTPIPWTCPTGGPESVDSKGKIERKAFNWDAVYKGGEEWSFEEIRARTRGLLGKETRGQVQDWERAWHKPGSSTPKAPEKKKSMPSPTVNTKLANEEIMGLFNQTIHGGKVRAADSDDEDDSGSSDDEDENAPHAYPTPLPARGQPAMLAATPGAAVPPTPTPAGFRGHPGRMFDTASSSHPPVFSDENAPTPAQSARKMNIFTGESDENAAVPPSTGKRNVFSATPARTPLAPSSSSKARPFGVFSEDAENAENADAMVTPAPKPRRPLGAVNVFATPAVADRQAPSQPGFGAIVEENEAEGEAAAEQGGNEVVREEDEEQLIHQLMEEHVNINDQDDDDENRYRHGRPMRRIPNVFDMMTPITERTCEFTSVMTGRSKARSSVSSEYDGDAAMLVPDSAESALPSVVEEEEVGASVAQGQASARSSDAHEVETAGTDSDLTSPTFDRFPEGQGEEAPFRLSDGFTINHDLQDGLTTNMATVHIVDRSITPVGARDASVVEPIPEALEVGDAAGVLTNPCNPADDAVVDALLALVNPPVAALPGFIDMRTTQSNRLDALQKDSRARVRRASTSSKSAAAEDGTVVDIGGRAYEIRDKLGEGGYGAVFLGVDVAARAEAEARDDADSDEDEDEDDDEDAGKSLVAIKVEKPASVWEAVVLDRVHARLNAALVDSVIRSRGVCAYNDESFLLLDYSAQGTLLDVVNKAVQWGICPGTSGGPSTPDELLAIFFAIEILRLVEGLHDAGFIHGDLKIDNCLVRLDAVPGGKDAWGDRYDRTGAHGWSSKGVRLIDFGRAADLDLYPAGREGQTFVADWKTDERDCVEMREGRPWSYETDYFGLASICYCLLFGKYISTTEVAALGPESSTKRYKIDTPLKRYWQTELWSKLFEALLNPRSVRPDASLPITSELGQIRQEFELWLEENCQKGGKLLKPMLKRIELRSIEARAKV